MTNSELNKCPKSLLIKDSKNTYKPIDFYCFTSMTYVSQPVNSNWCWANSLQIMISGIDVNSKIGTKNHEIAFNYKKYLQKHDIDLFNHYNLNLNKCSPNNPDFNGCDIPIKDEHIKPLFEMAGFKINNLNSLNELKDYNEIVQKLKDNQAPLILRIFKNQRSHIILVTGYGKSEECNYLLISDPDGSEKENYVSHKDIINIDRYNIQNAWYVISESKNNLTKDFVFEKRYNNVLNYLEEFKSQNKSINLPKKILDPWFYFSEYKENEIFSICDKRSKKSVTNLTIKYIDFKDVLKHNYLKNEEVYSYFENIETKVKIKKINDSVYVRPFISLSKHTINKKWQLYEEFIKNINQKK